MDEALDIYPVVNESIKQLAEEYTNRELEIGIQKEEDFVYIYINISNLMSNE
jgi:hypothetical protein